MAKKSKKKKAGSSSVVRKSNLFIDGRYRFGLHEQKILLLIISQIRTDQKEFIPYRVPWTEIKRISKGKLNTVAKINAACEKLKNKTISINIGAAVDNFGFLSGWKTRQGKYVEFRLDPGMKKMLLGLLEQGNFTLYHLEFALALPSPHAIRMYEILKSHVWRKQPVIIPLVKLKSALDIPLNSKTYANFSNFRQFILERTRKNLSKHTDIAFTYEPIKEGRKVASVAFQIRDNSRYQKTIQAVLGREFVRPGDEILISGKKCKVGASGCYYKPDEQKEIAIPLGDLTTMLKNGQIKIINEVKT